MRIVVDDDIWDAATLFTGMGEVLLRPGREVSPSDLRAADALIVRSVTRVNETLLAGSAVRFVGTATSGTDHVDLEYLRRSGIAFASAEGCNARPVVEYVMSCLFEWRRRTGRSLNQSVLGVVGAGRIGRAVVEWGAALGMRVLAVDPPLERAGQGGLSTLEQVLGESDIVTLHVPLIDNGEDATRGLIDARRLEQFKRGAWLINAARGGVILDSDLIAALDAGRLGGAILDVWSGEPVASLDLLRVASLLTPHIAGYSAGAHRRAAERIAQRLSHWINNGGADDVHAGLPVARDLQFAGHVISQPEDLEFLENSLKTACDVPGIDSKYRQKLKTVSPSVAFDAVRSACRSRMELTEIEIASESTSRELQSVLAAWAASPDDRPGLG